MPTIYLGEDKTQGFLKYQSYHEKASIQKSFVMETSYTENISSTLKPACLTQSKIQNPHFLIVMINTEISGKAHLMKLTVTAFI